ncbi:hypothetical protein ACU6TU_13470 [Halomonas sp. LS-001]
MTSITNFKKIRRDGKVIDEAMTAAQMISLGWNPEKVIELEWDADGRRLIFKCKHGLLAVVVPNRRTIAVLKENDDSDSNNSLLFLDASGREKFRVNNQVMVGEKEVSGTFCWFEPSRDSSPDVIGVTFRLDEDQSMVQVDIDANTGGSVGVYRIR